MVSASFYSSCNAARYPRIRSFFLSGKLRKPSRIIFSSVFAAHISRSTAFRSISFSPKSSYGVTFSNSQIFSILSADGFVPFLFQSLMVLCEIPVSSENSFWVTPFRRINSKIFSLIILYFTFSLRFCFTISQNSLSVTSSNAEKTPLPALCGFRIFFLRSNKKRNGNAWEKMRHAKKQPEFPFLHRNSDCFYAFCSASTSRLISSSLSAIACRVIVSNFSSGQPS